MAFDKLIGNEKIKSLLEKSISSKNILHSYLFTGIEGIGKKEFANEFAKMILCMGQNSPCGRCKSCMQFESNNHPDYIMIDSEDKKIKIEQIRYLQEKISEKPITSDRKVYIINDSDTMTKEAQNCLLKTLEEPPEYATLILICSNENKLLNTIRSRCIKISFSKIEDEQIEDYLRKNKNMVINKELLSMCLGSIATAINVCENKEQYLEVDKVVENITKKDLVEVLNNAEILYKAKEDIQELLNYMNVLLYNQGKINCIKYVEEAKKRILSNSNYDMTIDYLLIKIWEEVNEKYSRR